MRQWHRQWAFAGMIGLAGLSAGAIANAQQAGEPPTPPAEVDVAEEVVEPAVVDAAADDSEAVQPEVPATQSPPVEESTAPMAQPLSAVEEADKPLPTPDEKETVERGVLEAVDGTEAEVDRQRRGAEDATAETLDGPRPVPNRDPLGLETPEPQQAVPGNRTLPADAGADIRPRAAQPRITTDQAELQRIEDDRNARWRFKQHAGRWWYWTPQGHWMIFDGSKWIRYEEGVVVPHSAGYRATVPIDVRIQTTPGIRVYSGTRYVPGAGYDGVGGYYQVPRYGYGYQGFYGSYYDYGPYAADYYDPYYDPYYGRGWVDPGAARGADIGGAIGGAIGGWEGARIGAGIGAGIGRGR